MSSSRVFVYISILSFWIICVYAFHFISAFCCRCCAVAPLAPAPLSKLYNLYIHCWLLINQRAKQFQAMCSMQIHIQTSNKILFGSIRNRKSFVITANNHSSSLITHRSWGVWLVLKIAHLWIIHRELRRINSEGILSFNGFPTVFRIFQVEIFISTIFTQRRWRKNENKAENRNLIKNSYQSAFHRWNIIIRKWKWSTLHNANETGTFNIQKDTQVNGELRLQV